MDLAATAAGMLVFIDVSSSGSQFVHNHIPTLNAVSHSALLKSIFGTFRMSTIAIK